MVTNGHIGRRSVLAGALASLALPASAGRLRLAAIDWAMLETAMALGAEPVAACELIRYRETAVTPEIPARVTDLGLRGSPNFELLQLTRPDLILTSNYYTQIEARLRTIAPVLVLPFYVAGEPPWAKAVTALLRLSDELGMPERGVAVARAAEDELAMLGARLAQGDGRPVYVIDIGDPRHFRAFGPDSMFGEMLTRLGLANAWSRPSRFAFSAPVPLERLAEEPEARIVTVSGVPVLARRALERSVLWTRLNAVARGRVLHLPDVNPFGGVPAGLRFARLLSAAMTGAHTGPAGGPDRPAAEVPS